MLKAINKLADSLLGNLTVKQQISLGFITMIGLLFLSGLASYVGVNFIIRDANEMAASNQLDASLAQREVDHLIWANRLNNLFTDDSITELNVATDDRQCALGRWLYGSGRQEAEALLPSLAPLLREMEQPHFRLHQTAVRIGELFRPADQHLTNFLREVKIAHLNWVDNIKNAFLDPESRRIEIQTNPRQCVLGRWLYSDEFSRRRQQAPELAAFWRAVEAPHTQLHESVIAINEHLEAGRRQAALNLFREQTLPAAAATIAAIDQALAWLDGNLEGYQAAQRIYTGETMAALEEVQGILSRTRKHVAANLIDDEGLLETAWGLKWRVTLVVLGGAWPSGCWSPGP